MAHTLENVVHFTSAQAGWKSLDVGGKVPIRVPANYYRWYCSCGTVGGNRSSRVSAVAGHSQHVKDSE